MNNLISTTCLGTRGSALARWQTQYVHDLLQTYYPHLNMEIKIITTYGDQVLDTPLPLIGGKGVFTAELEAALHCGDIDIATHSLKDLPTELPLGLAIGAVPLRVNPADVLISRFNYTLESLPIGAIVGTSSQRRAAQLLYRRPDIKIIDIRGNVDTRIRKALDADGPFDAIIMAYAGLQRLGLLDVVSQVLPFDYMLPAPGQGALGIQCRDEDQWLTQLAFLNHLQTAATVEAERAFLTGLGGGCSVPVSSYAHLERGYLHLQGRVTAVDGSSQIDLTTSAQIAEDDNGTSLSIAYTLGMDLAKAALERGANAILETVR